MQQTNKPLFKGAMTIYSAPLLDAERSALSAAQLAAYEANGGSCVMVAYKDHFECNLVGFAQALGAAVTGFVKHAPPDQRRKLIDSLLVLTVLAYEAGTILAESNQQ
jgi:hypothetical protein